MTERRKLKKELSKLKSFKNSLPRLMDCSEVYGDNYFNEDILKRVEDEIKIIEEKIARIDSLSQTNPC